LNIGVIGGGAIGLLASYYLQKNGHTVTLYVRRYEQLKALQDQGLYILPFEDKVHIHVALIDDLEVQDILIVCTKQHAIPTITKILKKKNYKSLVLFLQNGMGHLSYIQELSNPVAVGVMEHGAIKINDYTVHHTGEGNLRMAAMTMDHQALRSLKSELTTEDFPVHIEKHWYTMLAEKLVINAVINPITSLFQVKNGQVIENPFLTNMAKRLCEEACLILQLNPEQQWDRVYQIAEFTKENHSSMAKDIKAKRKTEIEAILGYLLNEASSDIPNTLNMYESVKAFEHCFEKEGKE